jgi:extracellular factor (EF) 3-hydroxypalmitic acid methyl ester biosynthesis protein
MNEQHDQVLEAAHAFVRHLEETDRALRRAGLTVPPPKVKHEVAARFWALIERIDRFDRDASPNEKENLCGQCRAIVGGWLFRCRFFNRSFHKPHGYAGDFRMVEWMYDLETDPCADATQPGIVNCLDHVFSTVHSVCSLWERRHWLAHLLTEERRRRGGRLRVLDVACGGARYLADFLASLPDVQDIEITLVDQDAAALAYCRTGSLSRWTSQLTTLCLPIKQVVEAISVGHYDVVISAGLFDYLEEPIARPLLAHLAALTVPEGVTAITNFHPEDPSRLVKDWLVDWRLVFRTEAQVVALFPDPAGVLTMLSHNGALVCAQTGATL